MAIHIRGGVRSPSIKAHTFPSQSADIVVGRDSTCDVRFLDSDRHVGRFHFALREQLGRYRLVLNENNAVLVDGVQALDGWEIPADGATLQIGTADDAPQLIVVPTRLQGLSTYDDAGKDTARLWLGRMGRAQRVALVLGVVLSLGLIGVWSYSTRIGREVKITIANVRDIKERAEPNWASNIAQQISPSVMLVILRDANGNESAMGTGWVAAPGVVATNAHVASIPEDLQEDVPGSQLFIRSVTAPYKTWRVNKARSHPGFVEFQQMIEEYGPLQASAGGGFQEISLVPECDVALLDIEEPQDLPPRSQLRIVIGSLRYAPGRRS